MARTLLERIMSGEDTQQPAEVGVGPSEPSPQNDPTVGQSGDSEVVMDVYGGQENTITEVIRANQTDEDPEPNAIDPNVGAPKPPLPKDQDIVDHEEKPTTFPPKPENPPAPTSQFITEEKKTYKPIYQSYTAEILEVINKNRK